MLLAAVHKVTLVTMLPQVTAGIKDEVEKSHKALDAIVSLTSSSQCYCKAVQLCEHKHCMWLCSSPGHDYLKLI